MRPLLRSLPVLLATLMVSSCVFALTTIPAESVPADIRADVERDLGGKVTWRALYEQGGYTVVWYDRPAPGETSFEVAFYRADASSKLRCYGSSGASPKSALGAWSQGRGAGAEGVHIDMAGLTDLPRARKVVGVLTTGETVAGLVVNHLWCLRVDNPMGDFIKVLIQDAQGETLWTLEKPRRTQ